MINLCSVVQHNTCFFVHRIHVYGLETVQVQAVHDSVCTASVIVAYRTSSFIGVNEKCSVWMALYMIIALSPNNLISKF